jgi:hypothetical protein
MFGLLVLCTKPRLSCILIRIKWRNDKQSLHLLNDCMKKCICINAFKMAKYKRNNKRVKGILKVAENGRKWPLSDIWSITYQSKALFTAFSFMLLSLKPSWFVCKLLAILKLCRILSVPWNRYVCRQDWKDTFGFATFLLKLFKTGLCLSGSWYPKCILNVSYIVVPFVFSCLILSN